MELFKFNKSLRSIVWLFSQMTPNHALPIESLSVR